MAINALYAFLLALVLSLALFAIFIIITYLLLSQFRKPGGRRIGRLIGKRKR